MLGRVVFPGFDACEAGMAFGKSRISSTSDGVVLLRRLMFSSEGEDGWNGSKSTGGGEDRGDETMF
jgi:hypothetical protein